MSITSKNGFRLGTDSTFKDITSIEFGDVYIYNDILTDNEIMEGFKEVWNHYKGAIIGVIVAILILCTRLYELITNTFNFITNKSCEITI